MSTITKEWLQKAIADIEATRDEIPFGLGEDGTNTLAALRIALASLEAEAVCVIDQSNLDYLNAGSDADVWPPSRKEMGDVLLYRTTPPAPVSVPDVHHSVIAEQLNHVLSSLDATDHQRAVISCAVDRLNKVSQLLQASPSALLVPEMLDYQGAKELYNYLMNEEETNATVNGWNACRAAMLPGAENAESRCTIQTAPVMDSLPKIAESRCSNHQVIPDCSCRTCRPVTFTDSRFVVCPECGNKRCPHANDHRHACTGSNEPGQEGSAYPAAPQQEVKNG